MGKKLLDSKILYMVLAILLSAALWFYVNTLQGEQSTKTVYRVPVTFVGTDVLQERGLMLTGEAPTVDLEVRAGLTTLAKLDARTLTVRVDVSRITGATEYTLSYDVLPAAGISESSYTIVSREPANVTFTVARYATLEVPIRGALSEGSSIAEGYVSHGFQFAPETVTVSGREDLVAQVKAALVTISGEDLSETIQESRTYQLLGVDNEVLEDLDVTCFPEAVDTTYEIWREMEVPLVLRFEPGGGATEDNVSFQDISPESVTVQGRPEDMETLKELTFTVNLADVDGTRIIERSIPLADGLVIVGGVNTATITVTVDGLEKREFEIERGDLTLANVPEGFRVDIRTPSLTVVVRGTPEALEQVSPENIRGTVDVSGVDLANGQYAAPVKVQFDGVEGAGVLNLDYQVTVRLTKLGN